FVSIYISISSLQTHDVFFFSSRRRHTRSLRDWSSDVCSSDLNAQLISGELVRYAPDGSVERKIGMPVRNITSVVFGGEKLDEIYVTSMARVKHPAAHGRFAKEAKPQFLAGSLFRITGLGIRGLPEPRFAG